MNKKKETNDTRKRSDSRSSRAEYDKFCEKHGFKLKEPADAGRGVLNSATLPADTREVLEECGFEFAEDGGLFILPISSPESDESDDREREDDEK